MTDNSQTQIEQLKTIIDQLEVLSNELSAEGVELESASETLEKCAALANEAGIKLEQLSSGRGVGVPIQGELL